MGKCEIIGNAHAERESFARGFAETNAFAGPIGDTGDGRFGSVQALPIGQGAQIGLDLGRPGRSATKIVQVAEERPFDAIVNVDDATTVVAAQAATRLGLVSNSVEAARITRDKYLARRALQRAGLPCPTFRRISRRC